MKIDGKVKEILSKEAPAAVVTGNGHGTHLVGTWNSYIQFLDDQTIAYPAGGMMTTEKNIKSGSTMQMLIGSRDVTGKMGPGAGYRISGRPSFETAGPNFDKVKAQHNWARAAVVLHADNVEQLT